MAEPSIAIVIVSFNVRHEIDGCLRSLIGQTDPYPTTIVVVDNSSTDGTAPFVREHFPLVHVSEAGSNVGFARANNIGVRATTSDLVLFLNPDTIVRPGSVQTLVSALVLRPEAAAVGPRLVDHDGRPELSFGWTIGPLGELRQRILGARYARNQAGAVRRVEQWTRTPGKREWLSGAALMVRRSDLEAVNLFDERFFMYTEDVDLCAALRARGRDIVFVPEAEVVHLRGRSAGRNPATKRLRRQSQIAYYEKHHPRWVPVLKLYLAVTGKL